MFTFLVTSLSLRHIDPTYISTYSTTTPQLHHNMIESQLSLQMHIRNHDDPLHRSHPFSSICTYAAFRGVAIHNEWMFGV